MYRFKISIPKSTSEISNILSITFILMYSYSRLSWGFIIPTILWGALLVISILMLASTGFIKRRFRIKKDVVSFLLIIMMMLIVFNNNQDISHGGYIAATLPYICMAILYYSCSIDNAWIKYAMGIMSIVGLFYAFFTIYCSINTNFYYSIVYPLFRVYSSSYTAHPSAGFTAHYSTNGIYLSVGYCAIVGKSMITIVDGKKVRISTFIELFIILLAMMICGKRGITISLIAASFLAYLNLTIGKKRGRWIKLFGILLIACIAIFIASFFLPSISFLLERVFTIGENDSNTNERFQMWSYTWARFLEKPVLGYGWRWIKHNNLLVPNTDTHNVYIQLLAETGIVGSVVFLSFFVITFVRAYRVSQYVRKNTWVLETKQQEWIYISFINITYTLIYMIEGTALYMPECMITYLISCAVINNYSKEIKKMEKLDETNIVYN